MKSWLFLAFFIVARAEAAEAPTAPASRKIAVDFPGLQTASVTDPTYATGATLFYFPDGAYAAMDARGGSVAAAETTLLVEGSYSNWIDGVVFAGGSTLGLAAGDGVRMELFERRKKTSSDLFEIIPAIPTAVIFDFLGRKEPGRDPIVVPTADMGRALVKNLERGKFVVGRAGAGVSATFGKRGEPRWGGQGIAAKSFPNGVKILAAAVVNSLGDLYATDGKNYRDLLPADPHLNKAPAKGRQNTTLTLVVTNVDLDRTDLQRLAVEVHSSLGQMIRPVATAKDGDILFAVTTKSGPAKKNIKKFDLAASASGVLLEAIDTAVRAANPTK